MRRLFIITSKAQVLNTIILHSLNIWLKVFVRLFSKKVERRRAGRPLRTTFENRLTWCLSYGYKWMALSQTKWSMKKYGLYFKSKWAVNGKWVIWNDLTELTTLSHFHLHQKWFDGDVELISNRTILFTLRLDNFKTVNQLV